MDEFNIVDEAFSCSKASENLPPPPYELYIYYGIRRHVLQILISSHSILRGNSLDPDKNYRVSPAGVYVLVEPHRK